MEFHIKKLKIFGKMAAGPGLYYYINSVRGESFLYVLINMATEMASSCLVSIQKDMAVRLSPTHPVISCSTSVVTTRFTPYILKALFVYINLTARHGCFEALK